MTTDQKVGGSSPSERAQLKGPIPTTGRGLSHPTGSRTESECVCDCARSPPRPLSGRLCGGVGRGCGQQPRSPRADAVIVAPATYNTVNKWASGISDTYALGILAEAPGLGIPVVVWPFVNAALAGRRAFQRSRRT
ncbi:MAG: hypothetical protein GEV11_21080 [Streptosporangiales bacterium]|nr:hypothetical protein [Streptosporangiales bacterium]